MISLRCHSHVTYHLGALQRSCPLVFFLFRHTVCINFVLLTDLIVNCLFQLYGLVICVSLLLECSVIWRNILYDWYLLFFHLCYYFIWRDKRVYISSCHVTCGNMVVVFFFSVLQDESSQPYEKVYLSNTDSTLESPGLRYKFLQSSWPPASTVLYLPT